MTQYQYKISTAIGDASPDLFSESSTQLFHLVHDMNMEKILIDTLKLEQQYKQV